MTALEHLQTLREKFTRTVAAIDTVLQIWQGDSPETAAVAIATPPLMAQLPEPPVRKNRGGRPRGPTKPAKAARASTKLGPVDVSEWPTGTFGTDELVEKFGCSRKAAGLRLHYAKNKGTIRRVGYGQYEVAAKPAAEPIKTKPPTIRNGRQQISGQVLAINDILDAEPDRWFTAQLLEDLIRKEYPTLVETPNQATDLRVRLIDLAQAGKVQRRGIGIGATYRSKGVPVDDSPKINITVPRDLGE